MPRSSRIFALIFCGCLWPVLAGCGKYRERVERTERYLDYRTKLNAHLKPVPWRNHGLQFRVPKAFEFVSTKTAADSVVPKPVQQLNGVEAVWKANLKCYDGANRPAWLLVASNRRLWKQGTATLEDAERFSERTVAAVFAPSPESPPSFAEWTAKEFPQTGTVARSGTFAEVKKFFVHHVKLPRGTAFPRPYRALVYVHFRDSLQVAVIWLLPDDAAADDLSEEGAIGMSLETLSIHGPTTPAAAR